MTDLGWAFEAAWLTAAIYVICDEQISLKLEKDIDCCHAQRTHENPCQHQRDLGAAIQQGEGADATLVVCILGKDRQDRKQITCGLS